MISRVSMACIGVRKARLQVDMDSIHPKDIAMLPSQCIAVFRRLIGQATRQSKSPWRVSRSLCLSLALTASGCAAAPWLDSSGRSGFVALGAGLVAMDVSRDLDLFWNSKLAVPLDALIDDETRAAAFARRIGENADNAQLSRVREAYVEAVDNELFRDLRAGRIEPIDGYGVAVTGPPGKVGYPVGSDL